MKKLSIKFIGTEDLPSFDLSVTQPESKVEQVTIEDVQLSDKPATAKKTVEIDADVLSALLAFAKNQNSPKQTESFDNKALATALEKLAEATQDSNDNSDRRFMGGRPVDYVRVDKDDLFPNEGFAIFFAKSVSFAIYDDKKNGFTVKPPYNRSFKFRVLQRSVDKTSARNPNYLSLSAVIIRSKKEAQWLREHSLFGIKFHEQKDGGKDISEELQDHIVTAWNTVAQLDDHTVMQRCMAEGVDVDTSDISQLRKRLSLKVAGNLSRSTEANRKRPLQDLENKLNNTLKTSDEQNFAMPAATY